MCTCGISTHVLTVPVHIHLDLVVLVSLVAVLHLVGGELVHLVPGHEQRHGDGLDGPVAPAVVVHAAQTVQPLGEVSVAGRPPESQAADLKVVVVVRLLFELVEKLRLNSCDFDVFSNAFPQMAHARVLPRGDVTKL